MTPAEQAVLVAALPAARLHYLWPEPTTPALTPERRQRFVDLSEAHAALARQMATLAAEGRHEAVQLLAAALLSQSNSAPFEPSARVCTEDRRIEAWRAADVALRARGETATVSHLVPIALVEQVDAWLREQVAQEPG